MNQIELKMSKLFQLTKIWSKIGVQVQKYWRFNQNLGLISQKMVKNELHWIENVKTVSYLTKIWSKIGAQVQKYWRYDQNLVFTSQKMVEKWTKLSWKCQNYFNWPKFGRKLVKLRCKNSKYWKFNQISVENWWHKGEDVENIGDLTKNWC